MATLIADPLTEPFYYLKHFDFVIDSLAGDLEAFLSPAQRTVLSGLMSLPLEARALFVRLYLRKGNFFRTDKMLYEEVGPIDQALERLASNGFIVDVTLSRPDLAISLRTKKELTELGLMKSVPPSIRARDEINAYLLNQQDMRLRCDFQIVLLQHRGLIDRCQLAFFGNVHQSLSDLILTDLGQRKFEETTHSSTAWRQKSVLDSAALYVSFRHALLMIDDERKRLPSTGVERQTVIRELDHLLTCLPAMPENTALAARYHRLAHEGGRLAERLGDQSLALLWFEASDHPSNLERRLRILVKQNSGKVPSVAAALHKAALDASHLKYAGKVLRLNERFTERDIPRSNYHPQWHDLANLEGRVEQRVVYWLLETHGIDAIHTENCLFSGLFGIFFWEVIFAPIDGAFFHPYQTGPADLHDPDFYERRVEYFEAVFESLDAGVDRLSRFRSTYQAKQGIQNPFVVWSVMDLSLCETILQRVAWPVLRAIFESMARNPRQATRGFPDLVLIHEQSIELIEVKGPGDKLQDHQIKWLYELNRAGIPSSVMKIA